MMAREALMPGLHERRRGGKEVKLGSHGQVPFVGSDHMTRQDTRV